MTARSGEVERAPLPPDLQAVDRVVRVDDLHVPETAQARVAVRADERARLRLGVSGRTELGVRELAPADEVERAAAMQLEVLLVERVPRQEEHDHHEDEATGAGHARVIGNGSAVLDLLISRSNV